MERIMKKRFSKKLLLNKNTVANLDFKALQKVKAGGDIPQERTIGIEGTCQLGCTDTCCTQNTSVYPGNCC